MTELNRLRSLSFLNRMYLFHICTKIISLDPLNSNYMKTKVDESWNDAMKETKGVWADHPFFMEKSDVVKIINWMRGKK